MEKNINLQLGDIIEIIATSNKSLHEKQFYIKYIDATKIEIINQETEITLQIKDNRELYEESIESINILNNADKPGYALQNNLLPGIWISIYFTGSLPIIINGVITNLENDMIEIKTYPKNEYIYIDFEYKGIPANLNIEKIKIIDSFDKSKEDISEEQSIEEQSRSLEQDIEYTDKIKEIILEADAIEIGDELEEIKQVVSVDPDKIRYSISKQLDDLLDNMLSDIPNINRTTIILNEIKLSIERFRQLRLKYSNLDTNNNNVKDIKLLGDNYNPLLENFYNIRYKLFWILPVVSNIKKLYDSNPSDINNVSDENMETFFSDLNKEIELWNSNQYSNEQNKYKLFINKLVESFKPFLNVDLESSDYLHNCMANVNLDVIIDNLDNLKNYGFNEKILTNKKFDIVNYVTGLTMIESSVNYFKELKTLINIDKNDELVIKSLVLLPQYMFHFSNINLPYTNIITRANNNLNFVSFFKILNDKSFINTNIIDVKDTNNNTFYDNTNAMLNTINHFVPETYNIVKSDANKTDSPQISEKSDRSDKSDTPDNSKNPDKFYNFLIKSLPSTNKILEHIKTRVTDKYSILTLLEYIQPFLINSENINSSHITSIQTTINKNIINYKKSLTKNTNIISTNHIKFVNNKSRFIKLLSPELLTEILTLYNLNYKEVDDSELLSKIIEIDNAKLFNIAYNKSLVAVIVSDLLNKLTKYAKKKIQTQEEEGEGSKADEEDEEKDEKKDEEKDEEEKSSPEEKKSAIVSDKCNKYVLSKKYLELDELNNDNDKTIYFDKQYDKTYYDIINEYTVEQNSMSPEEFLKFLKNKLIENIGLDEINAIRDAKSMVEKRREIIDNDYCILESTNEIYIRQNNKWILDTTLKSDKFFESNKIFCNLQKECIEINDKCNTKSSANKELYNNLIDSVVENFDNNYDKDIEKIKEKLNTNYERYKTIFKKLLLINEKELLKYNKNYNKLGMDVELKANIRSPFENLKNKILSLNDFIKRQNYILKFCKFFTRSSLINEDPNWLYCIKTNYKLLPSFILRLAYCYANKQNYAQEIDTICAERGTISDDGNNWVDKYSGYIIKNIEFNTEEGFDEKGYKLHTRETIETEYSIQSENKNEYSNTNSELIFKIINAITKFIGIDLDKYNEFIINNVISINKKNLPSKENYEKLLKKSTTKGLPSYEDALNTSFIILTLVFILIAVQTSIPNITTKKIFPGCIKSFSGYPISGNTDKSGIVYIACVANKIKSNIKPWKSIIKMGEKTIIKKMEAIIEKFILTNKSLKDLFKEKIEYLQLNPEEQIPIEFDITNWNNFSPPLFSFKIDTKNLLAIENLNNTIKENIKKRKGNDILRTLQTKIRFNSLEIINIIQKIVNDSIPLLNNNSDIPFLENSCCNDDEINTINYFIKKNNSINKYNDINNEYNNKIQYFKQLKTAPQLFYPFSTKLVRENLNYTYSETTIYKGIIHYCKLNTDFPVDESLKSICGEKPTNINYNTDIKEIIEAFKREGKNYDINDFNVLINFINKQNILNVNLTSYKINDVEILRQLIKTPTFNDIFKEEFIEQFSDVIDTYKINTPDQNDMVRDLKNLLAREIKTFKFKFMLFFNTNSKLSKKDITTISSYFDILINIEQTTINKNDINYFITFIKNTINNLIHIFPNIILNKLDTRNIAPVKHWQLSQIHNYDIANIISTYYESLTKFYDEKELTIIIKNIITKLEPLNIFIKHIHYLSEISTLEEDNKSIFDKTTTVLLLNYVHLLIIDIYIESINNELIKQELYAIDEGEEIDKDQESLISIKLCELLHTFIEIVNNNYKLLNYNNKTIVDKIIKGKEVEKSQITEYLKDLTDEEREIENIFKNNKLEQWGVGLQKGMTQYVKGTYDLEREKLEKQAVTDRKMGNKKGATDTDQDIYKFDMEQQERVDAEIEAEENDMANIPDDDDYNSDEVGGDDDYLNY